MATAIKREVISRSVIERISYDMPTDDGEYCSLSYSSDKQTAHWGEFALAVSDIPDLIKFLQEVQRKAKRSSK